MISRDFFSVANNLGDSVAFNSESDTHEITLAKARVGIANPHRTSGLRAAVSDCSWRRRIAPAIAARPGRCRTLPPPPCSAGSGFGLAVPRRPAPCRRARDRGRPVPERLFCRGAENGGDVELSRLYGKSIKDRVMVVPEYRRDEGVLGERRAATDAEKAWALVLAAELNDKI